MTSIPSATEFCTSIPLYREYDYDESAHHPLLALECSDAPLDAYCDGCGQHSVFERPKPPYPEYDGGYRHHLIIMRYSCTRDRRHQLIFVLKAHAGKVQKIGQSPSISDLVAPEVQKYRSVLGKDLHRELVRGIGLAAHDVGIGSFIYLRRVFESLIERAHAVACKDVSWSEEEYQRSRMDEKIVLLRSYLPEFLVKNRSLYGVLSVGVHALSERECLDAFPIVRVGIDLILDAMLAEKQRVEKEKAATKQIAAVAASKRPA